MQKIESLKFISNFFHIKKNKPQYNNVSAYCAPGIKTSVAMRRQAKKRRRMAQLLTAQKMSERLKSTTLIYYAHSQDSKTASGYHLQHEVNNNNNRFNSVVQIIYVFHLSRINCTMYG